MKIGLVVFDMAGTTVRDDDAVNLSLRGALAAVADVTRDDVNRVMGIAKPVAIRTLLEEHADGISVSDTLVGKVHDDFLRRMIAHYRTSATVEPMPYTLETFAALRKGGVRIALDTGFSRVVVDTILERLGWKDTPLIDATVASDEVIRGRPYADLVRKAMALTGIADPAAAAKVGDTPADLEEGAAAACGLVVGVTNGSHTADELKPFPHTRLISDLRELPEIVLSHQ